MALRLRRGTDAERLLITPVEGELIYTTDTKLLYAGDGTTAGGTLVTGSGGGGGSTTLDALTDTDLTGASNNDVLTYNSGTSKWESVAVPGVGILSLHDLSDVFMPSAPSSNDILRFDGVNFTAHPISRIFNEQQNYKINIVGDDSTIIINTDTNNVTGNFFGDLTGNVTGTFDGDMTGSLFADDSTLLVDGVAGKITGPIDCARNSFFEANLQLFKNVASDATRQQVSVYSNQHGAYSQTAMNITNTGDTAVANELGFFKVRGTAQEFTATQASDSLGGVSWAAYDGSLVQIGSSVKSEVVSISANNLAAKMCFYVRNGLIATYVKKAELSETGVFKVNAIESFTADTDLTIIANGTGAVKITDVQVFLPNLPTSDPSVAGQLWSNSGVVTISAG
jgi:hypothetical protein